MIARRACRGSRVGCKSSKNAGGTPATTEERAVTIIEMLVVIMVIFILAALVLAASSYVQNRGARARAETEIAAMSAALESYKADNGIYVRNPTSGGATDSLNAQTMFDPAGVNVTQYRSASLVLYRALSGDRNLDRTVSAPDQNYDIDGSSLGTPLTQPPPTYFSFKPTMLLPVPPSTATPIVAIRDPFGNSYGYSTANQANSSNGYNPTFDLWSTAGKAPSPTPAPPAKQQDLWIKNW